MMKHALAAAISSAALFLASGALADGGPAPEPPPPPPPAPEPPPPVYNWYTTIFGGASIPANFEQDVTFFDPLDPALDEFVTIDTDLDTGYLLGWTVGYRSLPIFGWFRIRPEAELSFRQNDVDFEEVIGFDLDNNPNNDFPDFFLDDDEPFDNLSDPTDVVSLMFNGWFDFDFMGFHPYIGGGIGVAWADLPIPGSFLPHFESVDFAWQAGGGFNFDISERVYVGIGYRYFSTDFEEDTDFIIAGPIAEPVDTIIALDAPIEIDYDFDTHEVLFQLGVRF
ncbi:MAG: outer membrane protein [Alphaproteobacteria bacterium]